MCKSVPQIAVFSSLTRTSLGPISGSGTCSIQMPLAASRLTRAFIVCGMGISGCGADYRTCGLGAVSASDRLALQHGLKVLAPNQRDRDIAIGSSTKSCVWDRLSPTRAPILQGDRGARCAGCARHHPGLHSDLAAGRAGWLASSVVTTSIHARE